MVFDGRCTPHAHLVGSLYYVQPIEKDLMINIRVSTQGTRALAPRLSIRRKHWVELQNDLGAHLVLIGNSRA